MSPPRYQPPRYRVILLFLALCCAAGTTLPWPDVADANRAPGPIGGGQLGTTETVRSGDSPALPGGLSAHSFVVADVTTGKVYAARNPHWRNEPASILKTLTALTILRHVPLNTTITPTASDLDVECTCVGLTAGKPYTVDALMHALLMRSGNDVANVLARAGGGREKFLSLMNQTARDLQANDVNAKTPSGLNVDGQTASAYDISLVLRAAMADVRFRTYFGTTTYAFGPVGGPTRTLRSQNELWHQGYRGQLGSKNGWTTPAGHTFTAVARRGDRTLLVTIFHADSPAGGQAGELLDWGFSVSSAARAVGNLVNEQPKGEPAPDPSSLAQQVSTSQSPTAVPSVLPSAVPSATPSESTFPTESSAPEDPAEPSESVTPESTDGPMVSDDNEAGQPRITIQAGLSMGAIGLAGLALLPGRRPPAKRRRGPDNPRRSGRPRNRRGLSELADKDLADLDSADLDEWEEPERPVRRRRRMPSAAGPGVDTSGGGSASPAWLLSDSEPDPRVGKLSERRRSGSSRARGSASVPDPRRSLPRR